MLSKMRKPLLMAALMLLAIPLAWSQGPQADQPDETRAGLVDDIVTAYEVAAFAEKYKSPEAYITAAGLLLKVEAISKGQVGELPKEVTTIDDKGKETTAQLPQAEKLSKQAKIWLEEARGVAKDPKAIESLIVACEKREYAEVVRGKVGGPANMRRKIKPNSTEVFKWTFKANEWAAIGMTSGSPLEIRIVGPNGGEMFALRGPRAIYRWMPKQNMTVTVRVHNGTKQETTFNLASN